MIMFGCYGIIVYWRYNHVVMKSLVYDCVVIVVYGDVVMVM